MTNGERLEAMCLVWDIYRMVGDPAVRQGLGAGNGKGRWTVCAEKAQNAFSAIGASYKDPMGSRRGIHASVYMRRLAEMRDKAIKARNLMAPSKDGHDVAAYEDLDWLADRFERLIAEESAADER